MVKAPLYRIAQMFLCKLVHTRHILCAYSGGGVVELEGDVLPHRIKSFPEALLYSLNEHKSVVCVDL